MARGWEGEAVGNGPLRAFLRLPVRLSLLTLAAKLPITSVAYPQPCPSSLETPAE